MTRPAATPTILVETDRVRVTRWDFPPGAETGWHVHEMDYVVAPVTPLQMRIEEPGGAERDVSFEPGQAYAREAGVEHNVINAGDTAMSFIEVELKGRTMA
ncbi:MAG: cupin domain-containing protein [Alphaproteobacteria bacterium]|nr:MAG: cupin domain-containing protein [Alphaproteobacteria bacterium]